MHSTFTLELPSESFTLQAGIALANSISCGAIIFLSGELGAGKTTLVRGFLQGLGYIGTVKSPTYTLVETYQIVGKDIYHFDLYRLQEAEEFEELGFRDYLTSSAICLIEWPECANGYLPIPDISCYFIPHNEGRFLRCESHSVNGQQILMNWQTASKKVGHA